MNKPCVYKITCLTNNKFYIGSTNNWQVRYWKHISQLKSNTHPNPYLQNAFNKYGEKQFKFDPFEILSNEKECPIREQFWIDKTNCCDKNIGFNISDTVDFAIYTSNRNAKKYIITYPNGSEKHIKNLDRFCRNNNLSSAAMSQVALGKSNQHKGYRCRYASFTSQEWKSSLQRNFKSGGGHKGKWLITDPNGKDHLIESLTSFCKQHGLSQGNMTEVAKNKRKQHKGYRCQFA